MIYSILLYILCVALSTIGTWTDLRSGNMRNAHLITAAIIGLAISIAAILRQMPPWNSLLYWGINLVLSAVVSIIFYLSDVWAPGDAKLFILLVTLYPQKYYAARPGNVFPALSIVVYAYAAGYLYLLGQGFRHKKTRISARALISLDKNSITNMLCSLGFFVGTQMLVYALFPVFSKANYTLILLSVIGLNYLIDQKAPAVMRILGSLGLVAGILISIITGQYSAFIISIPLGIAVAFILRVLTYMASTNSYREITGEAVKPGIILSFGSIMAMQKCIDPNIPHSTTENRRSRINADQAEAVKNWCRITKNPITIVEMLPFVPFILIAVLIEPLRLYLFS